MNPWGVALFRGLRAVDPRSPSEQAAFGKYLDQRADREDARADRVHGAEGVIPTPLWIVLFLTDVWDRSTLQAGSCARLLPTT